jgi:hypothetical protein
MGDMKFFKVLSPLLMNGKRLEEGAIVEMLQAQAVPLLHIDVLVPYEPPTVPDTEPPAAPTPAHPGRKKGK